MLYRLDSVTVHYGNEIPALYSVSLQVETGSVLFISGPAGAGKTTLLKLLYGGLKPKVGSIVFRRDNMKHMNKKQIALLRQISGLIFQEPQLLSNLTCYENIMIPLILNSNSKQEAAQQCIEIMAKLGINYLRKNYPAELSMGEKKLVAAARALVHKPEIIIADEPTDNLDNDSGALVIELLKENYQRGAALIMASNDEQLKAAFPEADLIPLEEGKILQRYRY